LDKTKKCGCCAAVVIALIVALRIGVGWHFLYEGIWKTVPSNDFSSKGFLGMAKGPFRGFYYANLPDLGGEKRLKMAQVYVGSFDENGKKRVQSDGRIGWTFPVIEKEWYIYFNKFCAKYGLAAPENAALLKEARAIRDQYVLSLREYVLENRSDIRGFVSSKARFKEELAKGRNDAEYQRIRNWDAEIGYRNEGEEFIQEPIAMGEDMQRALWNVLTPEQRALGELPAITYGSDRCPLMKFVANLPWISNFAQPSTLGFLDLVVTLGITAIGLCLMLGFCTRLAALGGACFLLNVVLSQFPWPTVYPYFSDQIGHFMIFSKDAIELLVCLFLASIPAGRWGGLDWFVWNFFGKYVYCYYGIKSDPIVPARLSTVEGHCCGND
jgi:uncharacterized membrane protein YphA (DoxX/SURF4 family)